MLNISNGNREIVTSELRYVVSAMRGAQSAADKLYFFSGAFGMVQRILNIEYDPELLFAHQVLNLAYTQINGRIAAGRQGPEIANVTLEAVIRGIEVAVEELASRWEQKGEIADILQEIAVTAYATTGNGNYLALKGLLII